MEIKVVSYFDNGTLYFVSDKVLSQCGLLIGVQYTNTSNEVVQCYYYMRKGMNYSYAYDTPVTNYQGNGSVFFVGCFEEINKSLDAVKKLNGYWVHKNILNNMGTSFTLQDETPSGYQEIQYNISFTNYQSKYEVHWAFGIFNEPIGTEKFAPVAGWFNGNGSSVWNDLTIDDGISIDVEAPTDTSGEDNADSSFYLTVYSGSNYDYPLSIFRNIREGFLQTLFIDCFVEGLYYNISQRDGAWDSAYEIIGALEGDVISVGISPNNNAVGVLTTRIGLNSNTIFYTEQYIINGVGERTIDFPAFTEEQANAVKSRGLYITFSYEGSKTVDFGNFRILRYGTLALVKSNGIKIEATSGTSGDKITILEVSYSATTVYQGSYSLEEGNTFEEAAISESVTPWIKAKYNLTAADIIFGIKKGAADSGNPAEYHRIQIGSNTSTPISGSAGLTTADINNRDFSTFVTFATGYNGDKIITVNELEKTLAECWDSEITRNAYCYGANGNYDTYNYLGMRVDAETQISGFNPWSPAIEFDNEVTEDEIDDTEGSGTSSDEEAITHEEREQAEVILHIVRNDIDEYSYHNAEDYIKVRTNEGHEGEIDPTAKYNFVNKVVTPVYKVRQGDVVNISLVQGSDEQTAQVYPVNIAQYNSGIYEEETAISFPYIVEEDGKLIFGATAANGISRFHITIQRVTEDYPIIITPDGRRKKQLMSDDYIEIHFNLNEEKQFPVGTYVDDEIFGRFFIVKEQMPKENKGVYNYTLNMVAWHLLWGDKQLMLTEYYDEEYKYKRKEIEWSLTGNIERQALTVIHNLQALDIVPTYTETGAVKGVAENFIYPYMAGSETVRKRIAAMAKYKMAVGCFIYVEYKRNNDDEEFISAKIEFPIGSHTTIYDESIAGYGTTVAFFIRTVAFYTQKQGNLYIDAITGEKVTEEGLTSFTTQEISNGVLIGDYKYTFKSFRGTMQTNANVRSQLGMTYNGQSWYQDDVRVPLIYKRDGTTEAGSMGYMNVYINGGVPRINILTVVYGGVNIEGFAIGAFIYDGSEGGSVLRCRYKIHGAEVTYYDTTEKGCSAGSTSLQLRGVYLCVSYDENNVTVLAEDTNATDQTYKQRTFTWGDFLYRAGTQYNSIKDGLTADEVSVNDKYGVMMMRAINALYRSEAVISAIQTSKNAAEESSLREELKITEGNKTVITEETLLQDYIRIDKKNIPTWQKALTLSCKGTSIIKGLSDIAEMYGCEYWVEYDNDYSQKYKPFNLCFGKCEHGKELTLSMENTPINIEKYGVSDNTNERGEKLYIFGSNENVPYSYRKITTAKIVAKEVNNGYDYVCIKKDNITTGIKGFFDSSWFDNPYGDGGSFTVNKYGLITYAGKVDNRYYFRYKGVPDYVKAGLYHRNPNALFPYCFPLVFVNALDEDLTVTMDCGLAFVANDNFAAPIWVWAIRNKENVAIPANGTLEIPSEQGIYSTNSFYLGDDSVSLDYMISFDLGNRMLTNSEEQLFIQGIGARNGYLGDRNAQIGLKSDNNYYPQYRMGMMILRYKGQIMYGVLNYESSTDTSTPDDYTNKRWWVMIPNCPLPTGTEVEILNLDASKAPLAYFTQDTENPSSLIQLGNNNLRLPENTNPDNPNFWDNAQEPRYVCVNGYIIPYSERNNPDSYLLAEKTIILNDVYPKGILFVSNIYTKRKIEYQDSDTDNSQYAMEWTQYTLQLKQRYVEDGVVQEKDFVFEKSWATNETLKLRFLIPNDIPSEWEKEEEDGKQRCMLAGMTFEAEFKKETTIDGATINNAFVLVRNEDFGAKLPNNILLPTIDDPVTIVNWNVKAFTETNLVADAEKEAMRKGFELANAREEDNFSLNLDMMSQWPFGMTEEEGKYSIPEIGHRVCVKHGSLKNGEKHTRILGYELKLDKPYDTPRLTVGESEAYSRLKQLEKNITKLS